MARKSERNKDIRHTHDKEIYGRELSRVCRYTWELNLMFYGKEILHFCGY
jgi:hypothetical protein